MSELLRQLGRQYDLTFAIRTARHHATWPRPPFGVPITHVQTICAHVTQGWPRRDAANKFVTQYTVPGTPKRGEGPQHYISGDGTVALLIDLPRRTSHATWINSWWRPAT
jgi:hypothetical protein